MEPGDVVADRFELEHLAGTGGVGAVYRARDGQTGETVALKVLRSGEDTLQLERFAREAEVLATLSHPGIVRYVAHGSTASGSPFLAMEWLEGESLARRLARGPLGVDDVLALATRVADALGAAHERGVVHRDLKPANLFLTEYAVVHPKVLDFGVAHLAGAHRSITETGVILGTPGYMAPEQARGERDVDARADVFSLGCVLFRALTGVDAFAGDDALAAMLKVVLENARRVRELRRDVPDALDRLIACMLNKDPEQRPRDGSGVAAELRALGSVPDEPVASERARALTTSEWRLTCVLLARPTSHESLRVDALDRVVEPFGGRAQPLVDGSILVRLASSGTALDQAARGARCALAVARTLAQGGVALAAGRAAPGGRGQLGDVIDRAVELVAKARPPSVRVDDVVAGLLDVRFDVRSDDDGYWLDRERDVADATRTLLGKPTTCVGRRRELAMLDALFEECHAEPIARAVVITGPPGIGKSRLRHEFLRAAHQRHRTMAIFIGRGDPMSAGSPFAMLAAPVRDIAGIRAGEPLALRQAKLAARIGRHVAEADRTRIVEFVGELVGVPFSDASSVPLRAARSDARLMNDQMRRAFIDWLRAECEAEPVVVVLEDLHWGDLPSIQFVDAALHALHSSRLMVLALARPEIETAFPKLWARHDVQPIRLGPLTRKGSERLIREVLREVSPDTVDRLVVQAAGNAFYLEELIRAIAEGKQQLPSTVVAMAQARLDSVDMELRRVLRAAAVFGRVFWRGGVERLLGGPQRTAPLDDWLAQLIDRELVVARPDTKFPNENEYAFRHALFREAAYASLTEEDRTLGHRLAGEWLEAAEESDAAVLAEHFERGGLPSHAMHWYRRSAEQALGGNDFASVLERTERAIACGKAAATRTPREPPDATNAAEPAAPAFDDAVLGSLRLMQAEALNWSGELGAAERQGLEALRALPPGSGPWSEAIGAVGVAAGKLGKIDRLVELADHLLAQPVAAPIADVTNKRITALVRVATALMLAGRLDIADRLFSHVGETPADEPVIRARVDEALGIRGLFEGDPSAYLSRSAAAIAAYEEAGDLRSACIPRVNFGGVCNEVGAYAEAERALRTALDAAERMGLTTVVTAARTNLALALARQGTLEEATSAARQAVEAAQVQDDRRVEGGARTYLALILLMSGELEAAHAEARSAVDLLPGKQPLRARALATLSQIVLSIGRNDEALAAAEEAATLLDAMGGIEEGESLVRLAYAEALAFGGKPGEAQAAIELARERILARASAISDASWRACFLERATDNVRTLALAGAWAGSGRSQQPGA